ncbi:MAG: type II toxin-antitoxin system RelE/ParE family toxin [Methylococcaceae bacterium]
MACYKIEFKASAKKQLLQLPKPIINKVSALIDILATNPHPIGHKKLVGSDSTYRIRCGDYRIIYSVFEQRLIINIVKIGHRKDVYK